MDDEFSIGIGLIIGLTIASTFFIYSSDFFNLTQKAYLYFCILFPPLQWISLIIISFYNAYQISISPEFLENEKRQNEKSNIKKQTENILDLRNKGLLTKEESTNKINALVNSNKMTELKLSEDYQKLKELFDNGILTKEEFNEKIDILKSKI